MSRSASLPGSAAPSLSPPRPAAEEQSPAVGTENSSWICLLPGGCSAVFTALPISGRPINPDIMAFPCKRQFVKICQWAAVTISMGFISSLFTVCAHVYAALLSHHNPKLDCPLDLAVTAALAEQAPGLPLSHRLIFNFIVCFRG